AHVDLQSISSADIEIRYRGGVSVDVPWQPVLEGDPSKNLHVLKSSYDKGELQLLVEGRPELRYEIRLLTPWTITAREGVAVAGDRAGWKTLPAIVPADVKDHVDKAGYARWTVRVGLNSD